MVQVKCSCEGLHPGEVSHLGEVSHPGEVIATISTMQYMVLLWQFKWWFLLTGATTLSQIRVSQGS